jgi:hypothetical protein
MVGTKISGTVTEIKSFSFKRTYGKVRGENPEIVERISFQNGSVRVDLGFHTVLDRSISRIAVRITLRIAD